MVQSRVQKEFIGNIEFRSNDTTNALVLTNTDTGAITYVGSSGITTERLNGEVISTDLLDIGAGFINLSVGQSFWKTRPAGSYTDEHTFLFNTNSYNSKNGLDTYVDGNFWGTFLPTTNGFQFVESSTSTNPVTRISDNGNALIIETGTNTYTINHNASDKKLKDNIKESTIEALNLLCKIGVFSFDYKANKEHKNIGFVAQNLESIDETLVEETEQPNGDTLLQLDISSILALNVKATQELRKENIELKKKLKELENRISKIEKGE